MCRVLVSIRVNCRSQNSQEYSLESILNYNSVTVLQICSQNCEAIMASAMCITITNLSRTQLFAFVGLHRNVNVNLGTLFTQNFLLPMSSLWCLRALSNIAFTVCYSKGWRRPLSTLTVLQCSYRADTNVFIFPMDVCMTYNHIFSVVESRSIIVMWALEYCLSSVIYSQWRTP